MDACRKRIIAVLLEVEEVYDNYYDGAPQETGGAPGMSDMGRSFEDVTSLRKQLEREEREWEESIEQAALEGIRKEQMEERSRWRSRDEGDED